jgi:diguanylate cyclase (GGDEF)-like protein
MDTAPRHFTHDEIEILRTLARQAGSQLDIRARATLLESANEKLMALATCDSLTGLKNHRAFQDTLDEELDFAARNRAPLSVVLIDVDSFKDYNDTFGHPAGDEILQAISILLLESSREYDCVARYGGEEFALVLRDADVREAHAVAERLRRHIAEANWPERGITASVGVATVSNEATTRDVLVAEADRLLYKAKQSGKNRVCCESEAEFDPSVWDNAPQLRFKWGATSFKN